MSTIKKDVTLKCRLIYLPSGYAIQYRGFVFTIPKALAEELLKDD